MKNENNINRIILVLVIFLGFYLRLYDLSNNSFWTDELLSIWHANDIVNFKTFFSPHQNNAHPPFYFLLLKFWMVLGSNEFSSRLLSVFFGILVIPATYIMGRQLFSKEACILAAFFVAISPLHILYDREVRMYPLFTLLTIISLYYFIRALKENKKLLWLSYTVFTILNIYTHYHAFLIILAQWTFFIMRFSEYKQCVRNAILSQIAIAGCFSFWIPSFFYHLNQFSILGEETTRFPVTFGEWIKPIYLFYSYSLGQTVLPWRLPIVLPAAVLFAVAFFLGLRNLFHKHSINFLLYIFILFIPILAGMFISDLVPRYFLFLSPIYLLIIANGILSLQKKTLQVIFIVLLCSVLSFSLINYYNNREFHVMATIDPWRDVGIYLRDNVRKDDILFNVGGVPVNYYAGIQGPILGPKALEFIINTVSNEKKQRIWLVLSNPKYKREGQQILAWIETKATQRFEKKFLHDPEFEKKAKYFKKDFYEYRINIYLFERLKDHRIPAA